MVSKKTAKFKPNRFKTEEEMLSHEERLKNRIQVVFAYEDKQRIVERAKEHGKKTSEYVRELILAVLNSV